MIQEYLGVVLDYVGLSIQEFLLACIGVFVLLILIKVGK